MGIHRYLGVMISTLQEWNDRHAQRRQDQASSHKAPYISSEWLDKDERIGASREG